MIDEGDLRREEERLSNLRSTRLFFLGLPAALLLWWPTDSLLFRDWPNARSAMMQGRVELSAIALVALALVLFVPIFQRFPRATGVAVAALLAIRFGQAAALGGGATAPWWTVFHLMPLASAAFRGPLPLRAAVTFGLPGVAAGAFLVASPDHRAEPATAYLLSTLAFACLVGVVTGHLGERLWNQAFELRQALKREAARLEDRVREQTAELRLLTAGIQTAREAERKHIARELHDDLGQQLTGLGYALTLIDQRFEKEPASVAPNLRDLHKQLDRTTETMRRILLDLRPPQLAELGLVAAAQSLVGQFEERAGLETSFEASGAFPRLPEDLSAALYRVLQEALNNVARHAQARQVSVALFADDASLRLIVTDDGVGPAAAKSGGLGVIGMRERVQAFGGELDFGPGPISGTAVSIRIPFASQLRLSA